jgi:hypothetical protein
MIMIASRDKVMGWALHEQLEDSGLYFQGKLK